MLRLFRLNVRSRRDSLPARKLIGDMGTEFSRCHRDWARTLFQKKLFHLIRTDNFIDGCIELLHDFGGSACGGKNTPPQINCSCAVAELIKRWNPVLLKDAPRKAEGHRALDDIRESVFELRYYRDSFCLLASDSEPSVDVSEDPAS